MEISKADRIRELRAGGLTVREIASRLDCSYQYAARIASRAPKPSMTVSIDAEGRTVVSGDLAPKLLATHVVKALSKTADVQYHQ